MLENPQPRHEDEDRNYLGIVNLLIRGRTSCDTYRAFCEAKKIVLSPVVIAVEMSGTYWAEREGRDRYEVWIGNSVKEAAHSSDNFNFRSRKLLGSFSVSGQLHTNIEYIIKGNNRIGASRGQGLITQLTDPYNRFYVFPTIRFFRQFPSSCQGHLQGAFR
ncbi:unnamed protein product [Allacma fusca]|uniref:Uncharacterized protein n=1 Tax=Allacma fusca TaxID=39272 RepID=A0A8J2J1G3_9HEXA|nr:unnamed protein product [Allacma fusca]